MPGLLWLKEPLRLKEPLKFKLVTDAARFARFSSSFRRGGTNARARGMVVVGQTVQCSVLCWQEGDIEGSGRENMSIGVANIIGV